MDSLLISVIAFVFGTVIGSFLNVVIWRKPRGEKLGGRSKCPHCGYTLKPINLIPIFSYLGQGRRCSNCKKPISSRYLILEIITGLLFALAAWLTIVPAINAVSIIELLRLFFIISVLVVVFVIDLEHYLILDAVIAPAVVVVFISNVLLDVVSHQQLLSLGSHTAGGFVAAVLASGFFYLIWKVSAGRWMGFGDVKLNIFLGLVLGLPGIFVGLFLSFTLGSAIGLLLIAFGLKQLSSRVPFGTFLSAGTVIALLYGASLAAWYAGLIGWR